MGQTAHHSQNYNQNRPNLNVGWQKGFLDRNPELWDDLVEQRDTMRLRGPHEDRSAWKFFHVFKDIKQQFSVTDDNIYAMEDAAFVTTIYRKSPTMSHLPPYIVSRSQDPPQTKNFGQMKVSSTQSGWAESTHALDWVKTVFEPETRPRGRRQLWRILMISQRFRIVYPDFESFCWGHKIACISFPKNEQKFFNPMENIAFGPMQKSYTDYMRKRFSDNNENAITLGMAEFASWIQGEMKIAFGTASKGTELPPPQRIEALFSVAASIRTVPARERQADSRHFEQAFLYPSSHPRRHQADSPPPNIHLLHHGSSQMSPESQETQQSDYGSESEEDESDSENETVTNHHPITPCRTPRLPKTSRAKTSEREPSDSVMSSKKHRDTLDKCIDGSPKTQKRYRDDLILDRGDLEKENARLKERVELLEQFALKRPRLD
ncbi:hypothetical protein N7501_000086 [Penicillium viridicatum]|nr:hypothetical protein N7501_000086 [Penicillium viridicatum]